jgi:hypothetical protein
MGWRQASVTLEEVLSPGRPSLWGIKDLINRAKIKHNCHCERSEAIYHPEGKIASPLTGLAMTLCLSRNVTFRSTLHLIDAQKTSNTELAQMKFTIASLG